MGVSDATSLADELVRHSGLDDLKRVIDVHCRRRHPQLKAHSALTGLQQVFAEHPVAHAEHLADTVDELLADPHPFQEMKLLGRVNSSRICVDSQDRSEMERLLGGSGTHASERLGVADDLRQHALAALWKWREYADQPLAGSPTPQMRVASRPAPANGSSQSSVPQRRSDDGRSGMGPCLVTAASHRPTVNQ